MRILLIEDEDSIRLALQRALERDGHEVVAVATLAEGRTVAAAQAVEFVISDLKLPDGSGLDLAGSLGVPFLMLSGYATFDDAVRAIRLGAVDFFTKPVAIKDIRTAIARIRPSAATAHVASWSDPEAARSAIEALLGRLPFVSLRLAAAEMAQACPAGRIEARWDAQDARLWLDGHCDWTTQRDRYSWLAAHGIEIAPTPHGALVWVPSETETVYDPATELYWPEVFESGKTIRASAWLGAGSWLLALGRAGQPPIAGLGTRLVERCIVCGVWINALPETLVQQGVGDAERSGLLTGEELGPPVA